MLQCEAMSINEHPPHHVPVLLDACLELMQPQAGESYLDLTAGYGGHARAFMERTENYLDSVLVDRDDYALAQLDDLRQKGVTLLHQDFASATKQLVEQGKRFDVILVDLGVSSPQLDRAERGFSFTNNGPVDMRMDRRQEISAASFLASVKRDELARIIREYGEESPGTARRYAQRIIEARPIRDTAHLAEVVARAHVGRWQRVHPATRTFQAIRIHINDELGQVRHMLQSLPRLLTKGGRVGIISFHSLEDRIVKRFFQEQAQAGYEAELTVLTKKPISGLQDDSNPRSRSAKLRVAVKK